MQAAIQITFSIRSENYVLHWIKGVAGFWFLNEKISWRFKEYMSQPLQIHLQSFYSTLLNLNSYLHRCATTK